MSLGGAPVSLDGPYHGPVSSVVDTGRVFPLGGKCQARQVVLVAGGIGITPMLPLAGEAVFAKLKTIVNKWKTNAIPTCTVGTLNKQRENKVHTISEYLNK